MSRRSRAQRQVVHAPLVATRRRPKRRSPTLRRSAERSQRRRDAERRPIPGPKASRCLVGLALARRSGAAPCIGRDRRRSCRQGSNSRRRRRQGNRLGISFPQRRTHRLRNASVPDSSDSRMPSKWVTPCASLARHDFRRRLALLPSWGQIAGSARQADEWHSLLDLWEACTGGAPRGSGAIPLPADREPGIEVLTAGGCR